MNNNHHQQQQFQQNMQMGYGLTRNQSAPSSYFSSLLNSTCDSSDTAGFGTDDFEQLFNPPASTPDTQKIFSRFMNPVETIQENCASSMNLQAQLNSQFLPPRKSEPELHQPHQQLQRQQSNDYSSVPHTMYHSHNSEAKNRATPSSYSRLMGSINSNPAAAPVKVEGGGSCGSYNLIRHSSSPAGFFKNINIKNEIAAMGNFGAGNSANAESSFSSASKFKSQMDFSSRQTSSSAMMATISKIGSKGTGENNPGNELLDENRDKESNYISGYPINSWDDSVILSDNFLKGLTENDQGNEGGNRPAMLLSHHLSLPKSSAELFAMEQLLQDSIPCKIRAKRGFATHPRSIAERVRRTKISQRMQKLQELVPNMEKQTSTADMLDLAVDYIKDLQRQVKTLSDNRKMCSCSAKQEIVTQREHNH